MKITALIMCYNDADLVYPCLQSIMPLVEEVIVWDGDFWIGNHDPGRSDIPTEPSQDNSRDMIDRALLAASPADARKVQLAYFDGLPKMAEHNARNLALQMATGDYVLIVDCDEIWSPEGMANLRAMIDQHPDVDDFYLRNRLFFWNPHFYVLTKHMRLFKNRTGREFYGANEITLSNGNMTWPEPGAWLFDHYGYLDPKKVAAKMKWYDSGTWRNCGTDWFNNIFMAFDGTLDGAKELVAKNYGTLHPWGRVHPGFAAEEFAPLYESPITHHAVMAQYFNKMGFDTHSISYLY